MSRGVVERCAGPVIAASVSEFIWLCCFRRPCSPGVLPPLCLPHSFFHGISWCLREGIYLMETSHLDWCVPKSFSLQNVWLWISICSHLLQEEAVLMALTSEVSNTEVPNLTLSTFRILRLEAITLGSFLINNELSIFQEFIGDLRCSMTLLWFIFLYLHINFFACMCV